MESIWETVLGVESFRWQHCIYAEGFSVSDGLWKVNLYSFPQLVKNILLVLH